MITGLLQVVIFQSVYVLLSSTGVNKDLSGRIKRLRTCVVSTIKIFYSNNKGWAMIGT